MIIDPTDLEPRERSRLMTNTVLPRPIAWVSTMDRQGNLNVAPFSYFTAACSHPMTLLFCASIPVTTGNKKDTLSNVEEVSEFVINITNEETAQAMNLTATVLPHDQSEFEWAGLTPVPSRTIQVPRVAEAPISFECKLQRIVMVNNQPGGGAVVFGEVQLVHIRDDIYNDGAFDLAAFKPIGRLGGIDYVRVTSTFQMKRVPPP